MTRLHVHVPFVYGIIQCSKKQKTVILTIRSKTSHEKSLQTKVSKENILNTSAYTWKSSENTYEFRFFK